MYYMFGFLFLVFIILIITCSETTVLLCYFHLCAEASWIYYNIYSIKYFQKETICLLNLYRIIIGGGGVS